MASSRQGQHGRRHEDDIRSNQRTSRTRDNMAYSNDGAQRLRNEGIDSYQPLILLKEAS